MELRKFYQAWFLAFFSKDFYRKIATQGRGIGFFYICLTMSIVLIPATIEFYQLMKVYAEDFQQVLSQVNHLNIENGKLHFDQTSTPLYIYDQSNPNRLIAIIDPYATQNTDAAQTQYFFKKDSVSIKQPDSSPGRGYFINFKYGYLHSLPFGADKMSFDKDTFPEKKTGFVLYLVLVFYAISLGSGILYRYTSVLIYALIGSLFFKREHWHSHLSVAGVLRLTAAAVTPVLLVPFLLDIYRIFFGPLFTGNLTWLWMMLVGIGLVLFYLHFAFEANRQEETIVPG